MKYQEALIAWTPGTDLIRVGPLLKDYKSPDWTDHPIRYASTGGAAYAGLRECPDKQKRDMMLFIEFHTIVVGDRVSIEAAHREFLKIDEYRQRISPDIPGAEGQGQGGW
ncbi:MAG: hypothetical protein HIU82_13870 [Proteobacteria bacterium]|nr:hypothetical protein [Pseudomonadota bacterium]